MNSDKQLLLLKRAEHLKHAAGQWCWPGGRIDQEESPSQALQREMLEEIGTEVVIREVADSYELDTPLDECRVFPFLCELEGSFQLKGDEHTAFSWVRLHEINDFDCARGVEPTIRAIEELLKRS